MDEIETIDEVAGEAGAVGRPIATRSDHGCFGCGRLNPCGLHLSFWTLPADEGEGVWAPFTPDRTREGYTGVVHGGIVSTVLDEVMAWALYARGIWAVTASLTVRFRQPIEVDVPTRVIGRLVSDRGRLIETAGDVRRLDDGVLLAEATATFMRVDADRARAWSERYLGPAGMGDGMPTSPRT